MLYLITLLSSSIIPVDAQDLPGEFIVRSGTQLSLDGRPFYAVGVNSYFLQHITSYGDTAHVHELFSEARTMGVTAIRTWGFHDAIDSSNHAAIQWGPGMYNEPGLRALDFVLAMAREYGIRLIVPLVNNWDDYGGMNMYVRWYAQMNPAATKPQSLQPQTYVYGVEGRQYALHVTSTLTHDDFYRMTEIKEWFKSYCRMLLERVNTVTGVQYKEDPAIMLWELANEPRSSDPTGDLVYEWAREMSAFVKSVDTNHLVATGEEGHDTRAGPYTGIERYNDMSWLFDGTAGVSFTRNISLPDIDVATVHCYPAAWGLTLTQGSLWLGDHQRISHAEGKPLLLEEFGSRKHTATFFEMMFSEALNGNTAGVLPWQFTYDNRPDNDGYAFSCPDDVEVCALIEQNAQLFNEKADGTLESPGSTSLLHAYPNPFNQVAVISYTLSAPSAVSLDIYSSTGQRVLSLVESDQLPGTYYRLFDAEANPSGAYYLFLRTQTGSEGKGIILLK